MTASDELTIKFVSIDVSKIDGNATYKVYRCQTKPLLKMISQLENTAQSESNVSLIEQCQTAQLL